MYSKTGMFWYDKMRQIMAEILSFCECCSLCEVYGTEVHGKTYFTNN